MLYLSQISPYYPSGEDGGGEKTRRMKWTEARRCWQSFWMYTKVARKGSDGQHRRKEKWLHIGNPGKRLRAGKCRRRRKLASCSGRRSTCRNRCGSSIARARI